ncbi:bifunctional demethylmenaquinone methyltransferase/2-methoxy-6-polyprenyl-1,4-benzoquinol methylase UbiE [bacterium]|nr:bifunctional demethylmenaquinone methyltransferase/2-methoxy-6-polyprenyl-1,4-benzoquinol methylase UbiE [bacterium]
MRKAKSKEFYEYIRDNFSSVARRYDLLNHLLSFGLDRRWRKVAAKMINNNKNRLIFDLCTGTCDLALSVLNEHSGQRVIGIDFSREMLLKGKKKIDKLNELILIRSDVMELPLVNEIADGILIGFGLRNLSDIPKGLSEMYRILKENGSLVILEFSKVQTPILSQIYYIYFRYALPWIGKLISGNGEFYKYLHDSVNEFQDKGQLINLISGLGFTFLETRELTWGVVSVYHFTKKCQKKSK